MNAKDFVIQLLPRAEALNFGPRWAIYAEAQAPAIVSAKASEDIAWREAAKRLGWKQ